MNHTRGALAALVDTTRRLERISLQTLTHSRIESWATKRASEQDRIGVPPDPHSLSEVAETLRAVTSRAQWESLKPRVRRLAAWALWTDQPEPIRTRGILGAIRDEAKSARGKARLRSMIGSYFRNFDPQAIGFLQYATALRDVLAARSDSSATWWRARDADFALFSPVEGPRRVGERLFDASQPADELDRSGLAETAIATSRFADAAQDVLCQLLGQWLFDTNRSDALDRLQPILEGPDGSLRFSDRTASLANHLLQPWLHSRANSPSAALRDALTGFLLRHLGDPRLKGGNWFGVSADCREIFRRWLAREALDEFFEFISDRTDSSQWPYRRAFWQALAGRGLIEDSWVVLSKKGHKIAKGRLGSDAGIACGRLANHSAQDQSAILLRVCNLVFAEISHNGALHAWYADDPQAPQLGKYEYLWDDIYRQGLDFPDSPNPHCLWHTSPERGLWQRRAAALLQQKAKIIMLPSDWAP